MHCRCSFQGVGMGASKQCVVSGGYKKRSAVHTSFISINKSLSFHLFSLLLILLFFSSLLFFPFLFVSSFLVSPSITPPHLSQFAKDLFPFGVSLQSSRPHCWRSRQAAGSITAQPKAVILSSNLIKRSSNVNYTKTAIPTLYCCSRRARGCGTQAVG